MDPRGAPARGRLAAAPRLESAPERSPGTARADVAQLVERRLPKPKVAGSRPVVRFTPEAGLRPSGSPVVAR